MTSVDRWLARNARERPRQDALVTEHGVTSYAELEAQVRALAARLRSAGVRPGDRVAALLPNEPLYVALVHALLALEAALVPLNLRLRSRELREQIDAARPALLVAGNDQVDLAVEAAPGSVRVFSADEINALPESVGPLAQRLQLDADQAVLFTSGTTGRSKGVRLSAANQLASASASAERLGVSDDDRWLVCMPLYHVGGLAIVLRSAIYGTALVLQPRFDPLAVARAIEREGIRLVSLVPTMLRRVLDASTFETAPPELRVVLLGGGPIPPDLLESCRKRGVPVAPTYGLTEAASQVTTLAPDEAERGAGSAGRPLPRTEVRILDEAGRELPTGEPGEICVRGPQVMQGYLGHPEDTAAVLVDGWLHTGDIGELDPRGYLRVLDRRDDLIVSGGENVYPAEVEAVLLEHPAVLEAAVIGRPDRTWGQAVHAIVVLVPGARCDAEQLATWLRERLAGFKLPRSFEFARELPRTASGKLRRRALRGAHGGSSGGGVG